MMAKIEETEAGRGVITSPAKKSGPSKRVRNKGADKAGGSDPTPGQGENKLAIKAREGISGAHLIAETVVLPHVRAAATAVNFGSHPFGKANAPNINDALAVVLKATTASRDGNMDVGTDILTAQALSLDAVFTNLAERSLRNLDHYPDAADRYMRLALKAQANCRATLEALGKLSRGGEQVVRHIHVDNRGGQAMIAKTIQTGGGNEKIARQPQTLAITSEPALPCTHSLGQTLPGSSDAERALQDARGSIAGCT